MAEGGGGFASNRLRNQRSQRNARPPSDRSSSSRRGGRYAGGPAHSQSPMLRDDRLRYYDDDEDDRVHYEPDRQHASNVRPQHDLRRRLGRSQHSQYPSAPTGSTRGPTRTRLGSQTVQGAQSVRSQSQGRGGRHQSESSAASDESHRTGSGFAAYTQVLKRRQEPDNPPDDVSEPNSSRPRMEDRPIESDRVEDPTDPAQNVIFRMNWFDSGPPAQQTMTDRFLDTMANHLTAIYGYKEPAQVTQKRTLIRQSLRNCLSISSQRRPG